MDSQTISHYTILKKLGAGGMGEVYLAEDQRLGRKVALKFLPAEFSQDPDRVFRLEQEARAASALNHPNIVVIHDIEKTEGRYFLASEYVEGETLREKLRRQKIDLLEALDVAIQTLSAIHVAHTAGIVHRDIKPENIMLRPDGFVKILDFGLAKLTKVEQPFTEETTTVAATVPGLILGTVPYMSPEQARGALIDTRTDIFSLGSVLYEMITGRKPFEGSTPTDTLVQIIQKEPSPVVVPAANASDSLNWILLKALRKDKEERYQTAREFLADLKSIKQRLEFELELRKQKDTGERFPGLLTSENRGWWPLSAISGFAKRLKKEKLSEPLLILPRLSQITFADAIEQYPDWSPDERALVFCRETAQRRKIFLKHLESGEEIQLTSSAWDEIQPSWSPDGKQILFVRAREANAMLEPWDVFGAYDHADIWLLNLETRKEVKIMESAFNPSYSADGKQIAFDASWAGPRRIWISDRNGHNAQQITSDISEEVTHVRPRWSPDGKRIVFQNIERTKFDIRLVDILSRKMEWVTNDLVQDLNPVFSPSGKWIYFSSYRSGGLNVWRIRVSANGSVGGLPQQLTAGAGQDVELAISRDGKRLAFSILKQNADIWRLPVNPASGEAIGSPEQVIATTREDSRGAWSADGTAIAFNSDRNGHMNIWRHSLKDNSVRQITKGPGGDFQANWSPDGKQIAFFSSRAGTPDIWIVDCETGDFRQLTRNTSININPFFSPDGKKIGYHSDQSGRPEIWVMNPDGSDQRQLTQIGCGGHFMRWSPNGEAIIFNCPYGEKPKLFSIRLNSEEPEPIGVIAGGSHLSFSPDHSLIMDVVAHKILWASPSGKGEPRKIFEFSDAAVRIDYPVWSPDGHWILFDLFKPQGGDIWMMESFEE